MSQSDGCHGQTPDIFQLMDRGNRSNKPLTVSELTGQLKGLIEGSFLTVSVQGEISNFRPAASGHLYFSLKDGRATVAAVMFAKETWGLRFQPGDGMKVVLHGRMTVYAARGQYQLVAHRMEKAGAGELALAFEALKAKLSAEGLFSQERKRPIPLVPKSIGLITSLGGAAICDFIRVLHARFPASVLVAPSLVQGSTAPRELIRALHRLEKSGRVDVIILTRGGGSMEDLWAFNDENLARAIVACSVPVISAVGHEIDFTIADFVSDLRCATPTDAARQVVPDASDLFQMIDGHHDRLVSLMENGLLERRAWVDRCHTRLGDPRRRVDASKMQVLQLKNTSVLSVRHVLSAHGVALSQVSRRLREADPKLKLSRTASLVSALEARLKSSLRENRQNRRAHFQELTTRLAAQSPAAQVTFGQTALSNLFHRLCRAMTVQLETQEQRMATQAARLSALSPFDVLSRGFSMTFDATTGGLIKTAKEVSQGQLLRITLPDRSVLRARVESVGEDVGDE